MKNHKLTLVIIVLGAILRFAFITQFPVSLNWDEVSHGYNAFSILKTGQDEWGTRLPLIFRAFGDYKLPVYIYATVIPVALFGLSTFSVRFVSALAGSLAVLGIYLLTNVLYPKSQILNLKSKITAGHFAAFFLAISPWHFFISRPALEANLALTLIIFGAYFLVRSFTNSKFYLLSSIFLSLSLHTYNTARVFVPLFLLVIFIRERRKIKWDKLFILGLSIFILAFSLVIYQVKTGEGTARYQKLAILSPDRVFQLGQLRQNSLLPKPMPRLIYNRPVYFVTTFLKNYFSYYSPRFLTQNKGAQSQFAIPGQNLFGVTITFIFLLGLTLAAKNYRSSPGHLFLLVWLLLAPVAAGTTIDPPQALRPNPLIISVVILSATVAFAIAKSKNKKLLALIIIMPLVEMSIYLANYLGPYAMSYSSSWQYGYQPVFDLLKQESYQGRTVIITKRYGEPHIFYAFYNRVDPSILQDKDRSLRFKQSDWFWTDKIDNVYFVNDWDIPNGHTDKIRLESGGFISTQNTILVTSPGQVPQNTTPITTINYLDGKPAFVVVSF
ncbi:MAG: hypothetical protein A2Y08_03100 [Planctomycetes bacterium GWA2_40_7]|nr:MAG: hypothetical protein A2Y08_03100 [Planctomycetes bacterium GWA2_40_7]